VLYDAKRWAMPEIPVRESETVEALKRARAMVKERWCPQGGSDEKGGVCPLIAVARQYPGPVDEYQHTLELVRRAIGGGCIPEWNEAPERTQAEVEAAFDRAIALARAERR
jgi:hypothetical protein